MRVPPQQAAQLLQFLEKRPAAGAGFAMTFDLGGRHGIEFAVEIGLHPQGISALHAILRRLSQPACPERGPARAQDGT